jgi:flavodoxin
MKAIVVYYSRTGTTAKAAHAVADTLGCDIEEIRDRAARAGPAGYIKSIIDALFGRKTHLEASIHDLAKYDLVIVGTPVWANRMAPAVRSYLSGNPGKPRKAAFIATFGGSGAGGAFKDMEGICGPPAATLGLSAEEVTGGNYGEKLKAFVNSVRAP